MPVNAPITLYAVRDRSLLDRSVWRACFRGAAGIDGDEVVDDRIAVAAVFGVHQEGRQPGDLAVEHTEVFPGELEVVLPKSHQFGKGDVVFAGKESLAGGR